MLGLLPMLNGRGDGVGRRNVRRIVAIRLALIVPLLIAALVLHLSGTDLIVLKIVRVVLVVLFLLVFGRFGTRRGRLRGDSLGGGRPQGGGDGDSEPRDRQRIN